MNILEEIQGLLSQTEWQPIKKAPKDGTVIEVAQRSGDEWHIAAAAYRTPHGLTGGKHWCVTGSSMFLTEEPLLFRHIRMPEMGE